MQADGVAEEGFTAEGVIAKDFAPLIHHVARVTTDLLIPGI